MRERVSKGSDIAVWYDHACPPWIDERSEAGNGEGDRRNAKRHGIDQRGANAVGGGEMDQHIDAGECGVKLINDTGAERVNPRHVVRAGARAAEHDKSRTSSRVG